MPSGEVECHLSATSTTWRPKIILKVKNDHFHLQPQFKYELFHKYFTSKIILWCKLVGLLFSQTKIQRRLRVRLKEILNGDLLFQRVKKIAAATKSGSSGAHFPFG